MAASFPAGAAAPWPWQAERAPAFADAVPRYHAFVRAAAAWLDLDPDLVHAIIAIESGYRPDAVSHRGAIGLMQVVPETGGRDAYRRLYGVAATPARRALFDPEANIWLGAAYLRTLLDRYLGHLPEAARLPLALAAYNWGPTRVLATLRRTRAPRTFAGALAWVRRHSPPETTRYVQAVLAAWDERRARQALVARTTTHRDG